MRSSLSQANRLAQRGFTLIELIVVMVILGILGATALPKMIDMRSDATLASIQGIAAAAASAMNLNYSGCAVRNNVVTSGKCVTINSCTQVGTLIQGGLPTGYTATTVFGSGDLSTTNGYTTQCSITGGTPSQYVQYLGISAGN